MAGLFFEDMEVGMSAAYGTTVTEADILMFSGVSGDTNPVHLNEEYAGDTMFKGRIAHGMLSASFISAAIGTKLPGPGAIYMKQDLKFLAPVRIGDTAVATVTVSSLDGDKNRAVLSTVVTVGEKVVIDGTALIMVPSRSAAEQVAA